MTVDATTTNLGFPKPNVDNALDHDVQRISDALDQIDGAIAARPTTTAVNTALGGKASSTHTHTTADVSGLDTALSAKATTVALAAHTGNTSNPHSVTAAQTGAPTTTGSGASGTWPINITGNAASATNATKAGTLSPVVQYSFNATTNARSFVNGIQTGYVSANESYPNYGSVVRLNTIVGEDGGSAELFFPYGAAYGGSSMRYRLGLYPNAGWTGWKTVIDSDNIGSQSVALAGKASTLAQSGGGGAAMTFLWSGQSGQPTWLWGGTDGVNMYVYNPSNFNVSYAASAGAAAVLTTVNPITLGGTGAGTPQGALSNLYTGALFRENPGAALVPGGNYAIYTGGGALSMYLPNYSATRQGDIVFITNMLNTWGTSAFTILVQSATILYVNGISDSSLVCDVNVGGVTLVCTYKDGANAYWSVL